VRSKAEVGSRLFTGVACSNPTEGMDVPFILFVVCCVGGSPCEDPIIRSQESYRCVCVRARARNFVCV
jgi:hypothetical protein